MGLGVPFFFFFWRAEIRTHPSQDGGEKQEGKSKRRPAHYSGMPARRAEARSGCSRPERTGPAVSTAVASGHDIAAATKRRPQPAAGN